MASRTRSSVVRALAALAVAVSVAGLGATPASAHSQLTGTTPEDGAVLAGPPPEVRLTFDSTLLDDTDTISINDENGNVVKSIHPKPEGSSVAIPWPEGTKPGTYQVAYRVVCGDGHPVVGAMSITITGGASTTTANSSAVSPTVESPTGTSPASPSSPAGSTAAIAADSGDATPPAGGTSGSPMALIAGAAILGAGVIALVVAVMTRRRGTASPTTT
jgi:methionine-rich copper-binding protein CopC